MTSDNNNQPTDEQRQMIKELAGVQYGNYQPARSDIICTTDLKNIWGNKENYSSNSLTNQKTSDEDIDFVFHVMSREAPHDIISIKQLGYGMFSAFTRVPLPHNVNSKDSGSGKSYLLNLVASYFPDKYVTTLAGLSDKALFHRTGIMVLKDEESGELRPVEPIINQLNEKIQALQDQMREIKSMITRNNEDIRNIKKEIKEIESEIASLLKVQKKLIVLDNMIIIIQDTPQDSLVETLMSLISQDSQRDQEYEFTDKSSSGKLGSRSNILRGMPVLFTTRVIDDTKNLRFQEKNRRFINVTPNTSFEKIQSALGLIGRKYGCLPEEYDELAVSREDKEKAKVNVLKIVEKLKVHSSYLGYKESGVKIPFDRSIKHGILKQQQNNVWSMTAMDRAMRYLSTITNVHMDSRPSMLNTETGVVYPISTFKDLRETLTLMERGGGNIRAYIVEWYNKVFTPAFKSLDGQPRVSRSEYGDVIAAERYAGLTTEELAEKTKEVYGGQKPGSRQVRESYLYPLVNQGVINYSRSQINGQENIYFPVGDGDEEDSIFSFFENNDDLRLKIVDPSFYPSKNVLEKEFRTIVKREGEERVENSKFSSKYNSKYKIIDYDGKELTARQLLDKYFDDPESCFVRQFSDDQMYHSDSNATTITNILHSHQQQLINCSQNQYFQNAPPSPPLDRQNFSNNLPEETSNTCANDSLKSNPIPTIVTIVNSKIKLIKRVKGTLHMDFPPNCYYCNFKPDSASDYEIHVIMKHSGKPAYPGPADTKKHMLKKQGMPWEDVTLA